MPVELRGLISNRVYGCDDCQLFCPRNKFAQASTLDDFDERNGLGDAAWVDLFAWTAEDFDKRMEGSAMRRVRHERWLRNMAVGLGNAAAAGKKGVRRLLLPYRHARMMLRKSCANMCAGRCNSTALRNL